MICGISLVGTAFLEKYALARRVVAPRSSTESSAVMSVLALRCAESAHPYAIVNGIDLRGVLRSAIGRDDRTAGTVAVPPLQGPARYRGRHASRLSRPSPHPVAPRAGLGPPTPLPPLFHFSS